MPLPSIQVLTITANGDRSLFENLMAQAGFKVARRNNDPLSTNVQEEAVAAIASSINEDVHGGYALSKYHKTARSIAENAGYVVVIENCGPPGHDPCAGDLDIVVEPFDDESTESPEIQQIANLPIGTELASEILSIIKGESLDGEMGGEMDGEMGDVVDGEMGDEMGDMVDDEIGGEMGDVVDDEMGDEHLENEPEEIDDHHEEKHESGKPF